MWQVDGRELLLLKGGGGERFAAFVDGLIRAEAAAHGLRQSEIDTQVRGNISDGGVDTRVRAAVPGDESGWLSVPTCWQYKAQEAADIADKDLREEIKKPEVVRLMDDGHAFRLCIVGDLPPQKRAAWEELLLDEANKLAPTPETPLVVAADKIAAWASRFLAIISRLRNLPEGLWSLERWKDNATAVTRNYVDVSDWSNVRDRIISSVDFSADVPEACLSIQGEAGVGKTRLVYECIASLPQMSSMAIYTSDESTALKLATSLASSEDVRAVVVVADECSLSTRVSINNTLRACRDRVRFVCLNNAGIVLATQAAEIWLEHIPEETVREVLERNFPDVPSARRFDYARLAGGFIRIAADLCRYDAHISAQGEYSVPGVIDDYVRQRVGQHWDAFTALALFPRVGFKEDVAGEIDALCMATGLSKNDFRKAADQLKNSPGFVNHGGRFWYVTPALVARIAFAGGWDKWVSDDPAAFLDALTPSLQEGFLKHSRARASKEVLGVIAEHFRNWFESRDSNSLTRQDDVEYMALIAEADPERYLPLLRTLVESASDDQVVNVSGDWAMNGWGPRRSLVWLGERLVSFPEYFADSEAILYRLAKHETEPNIGNNATTIWRQLFSLRLSGTATPFEDRFPVLKRRLAEADADTLPLIYRAVHAVLIPPDMRVDGPEVAAGRIPPPDWQPRTYGQQSECVRRVLGLVVDESCSESVERREMAIQFVVENLVSLLNGRYLDEIQSVLGVDRVGQSAQTQVLVRLDDFLSREDRTDGKRDEQDRYYFERVAAWRDAISPSDFSGRLRALISRDLWDTRFLPDSSGNVSSEIQSLADESLADRERLLVELPWIAGPEARAAELFGDALGVRDEATSLCSPIFEAVTQTGTSGLARGYVRALARNGATRPTQLGSLLDRLENAHPAAAFDIHTAGGDFTNATERTTELVKTGRVPARFLLSFAFRVGNRNPTVQEVRAMARMMLESGDTESLRAGIRFLAQISLIEDRKDDRQSFEDDGVRTLAWQLVQRTATDPGFNEGWDWAQVVSTLAVSECGRAAEIVAPLVIGGGNSMRHQVEELLKELATRSPRTALNAIGKSLLDPATMPYSQIAVFRDLLSPIPANEIIDWLKQNGVVGARALARHLPQPFVDDTGRLVVPEVVEYLFTEFEADDDLFRNFCSGCHSGEIWRGNGAERFQAEAEEAKKFMTHPIRRIREWARVECEKREALARMQQREHEEEVVEF